MVAGPETARILTEYEGRHSKQHFTECHHDQIPSIQKTFASHVKSVVDVLQDLGNPFMDTSKDLYTLDTRRVMSKSVVETVRTAEELGKAQYK